MSEVEHPEDEPRGEESSPAEDAALAEDAAPAEEPTPAAESPEEVAAGEAQGAGSPAQAGEEDAVAEAAEPPAGESAQPPPQDDTAPVDESPEAVEASGTPPSPAVPEPPAGADVPAAPQVPATPDEHSAAAAGDVDEDSEPAPRARPEIPGADLVPDIVPEGEQFLDAEAQAAAEAEAEAAAAREQEPDEEQYSQPISGATIDLAAGARYTATGKRKTAVARVTLKPGAGTYTINGKPLDDFFPRPTLQRMIRQPLETVGYEERMDVIARMHGGGVAAQAGALRHGISRALIVADPHLRGELKRRGFLTRDPRVKERKKAGLKKARKRPQFSKR